MRGTEREKFGTPTLRAPTLRGPTFLGLGKLPFGAPRTALHRGRLHWTALTRTTTRRPPPRPPGPPAPSSPPPPPPLSPSPDLENIITCFGQTWCWPNLVGVFRTSGGQRGCSFWEIWISTFTRPVCLIFISSHACSLYPIFITSF